MQTPTTPRPPPPLLVRRIQLGVASEARRRRCLRIDCKFPLVARARGAATAGPSARLFIIIVRHHLKPISAITGLEKRTFSSVKKSVETTNVAAAPSMVASGMEKPARDVAGASREGVGAFLVGLGRSGGVWVDWKALLCRRPPES